MNTFSLKLFLMFGEAKAYPFNSCIPFLIAKKQLHHKVKTQLYL